MKILVTGSRVLERGRGEGNEIERELLSNLLRARENRDHLTVVVGDCPTGADLYAREWLTDYLGMGCVDPEVHTAEWETHGDRAGPVRNVNMVTSLLRHRYLTERPVLCLALPRGRSPGTRGTMAMCRRADIPVREL